jgi:hypothetical protein
VDQSVRQFYDRVLGVLREPALRSGKWQMLECVSAWEGNWTWECFLAFAWQGLDAARWLVTVVGAAHRRGKSEARDSSCAREARAGSFSRQASSRSASANFP